MKSMIKTIFSFFSNCITAIPSMDRTHLFLGMAVLLFTAVLLILTVIGSGKKMIRPIPALFSILILGLSLFFVVLASNKGTVVFEPLTEPDQTAGAFLSACVLQDEELAASYLTQPDTIFTFSDSPDEVTALYEKALKDTYSYSVGKDVELDGTTAYVPVEFTSLDFREMIPSLLNVTNTELEKKVEENRKSDIFDEDGNYKPEVIEEIYKTAVTKTLEKKNTYEKISSIKLCLVYSGAEWKVMPNDSLKIALAGGYISASNGINNLKSEVLGDLTFVPKIYTIDENATAGPLPNPDNYGFTTDPADIFALVDSYPSLTKGKDCYFPEDGDFICDGFRYYADETILTYTWREKINNHACNSIPV